MFKTIWTCSNSFRPVQIVSDKFKKLWTIMGKNHLDLFKFKPILNDYVGFRPIPHEKISGASTSMVSTGQEMSKKTDFQEIKSVNFHILAKLFFNLKYGY